MTDEKGNDDLSDNGVRFEGTRGPLARILFANLLLTILTIGIYRFWAKTRLRRYFWSHSRLLGEPLEYLGTGGEMFVGFLIAIAFLLPISGVYALIDGFAIPPDSDGPRALFNLAYYAVLGFLIQFAIYRMRRYRLTRTAWNGVRFGLDGSALRFAVISSAYGLLTLVTLGLASPWWKNANARYIFSNLRFGTAGAAYTGRGSDLFRKWIIAASPGIAALVLLAALNVSAIAEIKLLPDGQSPAAPSSFTSWPLLLFLISPFLMLWYRTVAFRYYVSKTEIAGATFRSGLDTGFVISLYFAFWFCMLVLFIVVGIATGASFRGGGQAGIAAGPVVAIFLVFLLTSVLWSLFAEVALLRRVCRTMSIANGAMLLDTVQADRALPSHGEGLADALDIGGF